MTDVDELQEHNVNEAPNDSLTLGQLKKIVKQFPSRQKPKEIAFKYEDTDNISNEIDEFYSYSEISQCLENKKVFEEGFDEPWTTCTISERRTYIEYLLELLELQDPVKRFATTRKLLYIAQGTFGETTNPSQLLQWIIENNKFLRNCGALLSYYQALKLACHAHDYYSHSDLDMSASDRQACIDDTNTEIGFYLTLLYMLLEVHRGDESFGTELVELDPPLAVFLFDTIASLHEKNAKGYPVKKLLLLLWKVLLASLGGVEDMKRLKSSVRRLNGLPPVDSSSIFLKAAPMDYYNFQTEVTQKYPTYIPRPCPTVSIPGVSSHQSHLNHQSNPNVNSSTILGTNAGSTQNQSPRSRKQQFQTNQRQPFIFPFSKYAPTVPKAIEEAGDLYMKYMYTGVGPWQFWLEKENMKKYQCGNSDGGYLNKQNGHASVYSIKEWNEDGKTVDNYDKGLLERIEVLYRSILPKLQNIIIVLLKLLLATVSPSNVNTNPRSNDNTNGENIGKNGSMLPNGSMSEEISSISIGTVEDVDIMRHREITSKAVSAILLLMLKHFKPSHILKFEYLGQLLVDSNCLLLILKIFGLQDVSATVKAKNEVEELNFFRYCTAGHDTDREILSFDGNLSKELNRVQVNSADSDSVKSDQDSQQESQDTTEEQSGESADQIQDETSSASQESENNVDYEYCWRNMFAAINFLRILQKLTKRKTHRIVLLVQYKSSAILKKILKVTHHCLELYALKVLKSQIPFVGRKWRQNNMKVITSIYMVCRPDLRDEWIAPTDADAEVEDAVPQEQALRELIKFYNSANYSWQLGEQLYNNNNTSKDKSPRIFPPNHTKPLTNTNAAYITDDIMLEESFLSNWEQWLHEEVYAFSADKPHLHRIDHYYNDDHVGTFPGDGSEWDTPFSPSTDDNDPFATIDWNKFPGTDIEEIEKFFIPRSKRQMNYDEDEMERKIDYSMYFTNGKENDEQMYLWPDEIMGPLAPKEIGIYDPTPYQSEDEQL